MTIPSRRIVSLMLAAQAIAAVIALPFLLFIGYKLMSVLFQ